MTTANTQANPVPAIAQWEPYPDLEKEEEDMQQGPPEDDLTAKLRSALAACYHYPYHPDVLIGNEVPIYYGDRDPVTRRFSHVVPDILIALNVDSDAIRRRVGYDSIQNGKPPDVVVEIASPSAYRIDAGRKRDVYQMLGVPEYWRFDPTGGGMLGQAVIGEQLIAGRYERLPLLSYEGGVAGSTSPLLNLNFRYQGEELFTIHDPATGEEYEHPERRNTRLLESHRTAEQEYRLAQQENERMHRENAQLREEIRRLQGG